MPVRCRRRVLAGRTPRSETTQPRQCSRHVIGPRLSSLGSAVTTPVTPPVSHSPCADVPIFERCGACSPRQRGLDACEEYGLRIGRRAKQTIDDSRAFAPSGGRQVLTFFDQALSSGTNFIGAALAAGALTTRDFGAFAVASSVLIVAVGLGRAAGGSLLMIQAPGARATSARSMLAGASVAVTTIGLIISAACLLAAALLDGRTSTALWSLAIVTPIVLVQDVYRHHALATERPSLACRSDGAWLMMTVVGLLTLRAFGVQSLPLAILIANGSALLGFMAVMPAQWVTPTGRELRSWLAGRVGAIARLTGDFILAVSYSAVPLIVVTAINADLSQAASLKVAQTIMGPLTVVITASTLYLQPIMVRSRSDSRTIVRLARRQSGLNAAVAVAWVAVAMAIPDHIGSRMFGPSWAGSDKSILLVGLAFVGLATSSGAFTALRSAGRLTANLLSQVLVASVVLAATPLAGAALNDGLLTGFAVGNLAGSVLPWIVVIRGLQRRPAL